MAEWFRSFSPHGKFMFLLLNLLFLFCMHLLRLRYLTVCLIYMPFGFVALNLIWLYDYWHIYIRLPTYGYSQDGKSTDPFCHVSLTLASSSSLLFPFFFSLSLSPLLSLYFISFSVISHEPGIAGNSVLCDCLRRLFLAFFEDSHPGISGNSVPDSNLQCSTSSFLLIVGYEPDIAGNSVSGKDFRQLSLVSLGGFESGIAGNSVSDKNLPYSITLLSLSLPRSGKGPCIMHTSKKTPWKVGSRYITPIQP